MHVVAIAPKDVFQALADPLRIRIVRLLATTSEEACLCEFVDSLLEAQYKLSRHVKSLRQAGILSASKDGRWIYHKLVGEAALLKHLYAFVRALPDDGGVFASDVQRFRKRLRLRDNGRCKVGIQTPELADGDECDEPKQKRVARDKRGARKS